MTTEDENRQSPQVSNLETQRGDTFLDPAKRNARALQQHIDTPTTALKARQRFHVSLDQYGAARRRVINGDKTADARREVAEAWDDLLRDAGILAIYALWAKPRQPHNLLSTATDDDRRRVIKDSTDWWNEHVAGTGLKSAINGVFEPILQLDDEE